MHSKGYFEMGSNKNHIFFFLVESIGSRADPVRILAFTVHFRVCYPCHCAQCLGATQFDIFEWEMLGPEATETCFFPDVTIVGQDNTCPQ